MNTKSGVKIVSVLLAIGGIIFKTNDYSRVYAMKRGAEGPKLPGSFSQVFRYGDTVNSTDVFLDSRHAELRNEWFSLLKSGDIPRLDNFLSMYGVECIGWVYGNGLPSLHYAALYGEEKAVKRLLDSGAVIDSRDYFGRTPLMCAVERFCGPDWLVAVRIIHTLCCCGANVNIKCAGGNTVLHKISSVGNVAWRQIFLNMGADDTVKNDAGFTPFQLFCEYQRRVASGA